MRPNAAARTGCAGATLWVVDTMRDAETVVAAMVVALLVCYGNALRGVYVTGRRSCLRGVYKLVVVNTQVIYSLP